ncbi:MAG: aminomethyl-transferring glycine dehydrogenase subunit GcvPB [Robiginitomaculum sp.]|nr:aminomethyl-transferring glycine dehydrogenase subunit GcvPB [Robiginitomaculum sp.]MDQ7077860.1 aminomethyl-transferring glycine dehydrogenase subunit GcvPB [Robiginitomaculum sp.]
MAMNSTGRPTAPTGDVPCAEDLKTFSGSRGLMQQEPLLHEVGAPEKCGVDLPDVPEHTARLGGLERDETIGLPGFSEPEAMRHYVRLSQRNYAIDLGLYPLGSCTMKHNPRLNEKLARLPGFADVHPLQPQSTVQGALGLMAELSDWLVAITGMDAVALSPKAGAHGEWCGMMCIRAAIEERGELQTRRRVLVPQSAHGTNPATAAACGFEIDELPADDTGRVDMEILRAKIGPDVAAIMLTNPNTGGLFERDIREIADLVHEAGGYFYCDGANLNAIMGKTRVRDLGVDAMHINLHKTFSTPHGGGGPGAGPVVLSKRLSNYAPLPYLVRDGDGWALIEEAAQSDAKPFGRLSVFHGQMGMFVRALAYMMSHGADGLRQVSEDAVLNANYLLARLSEEMSPAFDGVCMHEALFDDAFLKDTGVTTLDFAKAMIDEGYHPMTMYFPLIVHGAMLIEPTETESKESLDRFADSLLLLAKMAKSGDTTRFTAAPTLAPLRRLDETRAARTPILRWKATDA